MQFPFATKYNGTYYPAFTEIPVDTNEKKTETKILTVITETVKKEIEIPKVLQEETLIEKLATEQKVKMDIPKFTKTELTRMPKKYVVDLAKRLKIDGYEEMSGNKLKALLYQLSVESHNEEE